MKQKILDPDRLVDRIFPGRYLPLIFLWVILGLMTFVLWEGKFEIFTAFVLAILGAGAIVGLLAPRMVPSVDVAGQVLLFVSFAASRTLMASPYDQHIAVWSAMILLLTLTIRRGLHGLPLGPALIFIACMLPKLESYPYEALVFPGLIALSFAMYLMSKDKPPLPPVGSLAAAAIYVMRLGEKPNFDDISLVLIVLVAAIVVTVYLYRGQASHSAQNPNIHVAEDLAIYFLLLAAMRFSGLFDPLSSYVVLVVYFFTASIWFDYRRKRAQFVSSAVVTFIGLVAVLNHQAVLLQSTSRLAFVITGYCLIAASGAVFAEIIRARLPNHLGKVLILIAATYMLYSMFSQNSEINFFVAHVLGAYDRVLLGDGRSILIVVALCVVVLAIGGTIIHMDVYRDPERLWVGIVAPRVLASCRRLLKNIGSQGRSLPGLGFIVSVINTGMEMIRGAFGGKRQLNMGHVSLLALVALVLPTFAYCVQRFAELSLPTFFGLGSSAVGDNGDFEQMRVLAAVAAATILFSVGQVLRLAYLRLVALLVPLAFIVLLTFTQRQIDFRVPVVALSSMFVMAHLVSITFSHQGRSNGATTAQPSWHPRIWSVVNLVSLAILGVLLMAIAGSRIEHLASSGKIKRPYVETSLPEPAE